ncbi:diguanylate cyclase (GGDEF)-like protein [Cytobacillus firmus]|uniref:Diguanylate cyclase (GGDEF)-like protein n=2 Tax=Cytobacillus TaxID=2675230 RepID=A0A366JMB0_CYTFI|nr:MULTISPECIES: diguanylate cyclase [Cytobacillus]RBP88731.1 diguanylate cyclase (GGDEF)-like protein [Cytobacillus firmus]TDX39516.1 diguanylate cyclase (GGDEF)-like protein [Cytobacillus oceanisediminis]
MELEKYKVLLFEKIKRQIASWFDGNLFESISNEEVYRFLHSMKGTAGTIQLTGLHQLADRLMADIERQEMKEWDKKDLRNYLFDLIEMSYEYEHFQTVKQQNPIRVENAPLIQLIDDDISMLILLKDALERKGWMVIASTELDVAKEQYYDHRPDCLIIDINLDGESGFQLLEDIQNHTRNKYIPKIMISVKADRETRIKSYKMGADDFISKPIDLEEFLVKIERHMDNKKLFDQSSMIDELTRVYNRRFFHDSLLIFMNELSRNQRLFSLAMLDIDFFKKVNDAYGHQTGDKVLVEFAKYLKENVRQTDYVFRYGGEEFIILFSGANGNESKTALEKILKGFSEKRFAEGENAFSVTFSAGVFMVDEPEMERDIIIRAADQALYEAKQKGRARVECCKLDSFAQNKKKLHVSVIDDDPIIRMMLTKVLSNMELNHAELDIKVFEDGRKFLNSNRIEEKGPHFLILDGIMPVMDGLEVMHEVKKSKRAKDIHVLMLTGRKSEHDIARALKLGAEDYVTKPFSLTELEARIQRLIKRLT